MKTLKYLRSKLLELLTHKIALPLISKFRKRPPFLYSMEQLLNFPEDTLGKDLALYLKKKNFQLLPNYERHDCKHIILGYEMDDEGEARMQFYFLGNRRYSIPVIMTVIICFALMPEYWSTFYMEYKKGRKTKSLDDVDFNRLVLQNTHELRKQFTQLI